MARHRLSRRQLFEVWKRSSAESKNDELFSYIVNHLGIEDISGDLEKRLKEIIRLFCVKILARWTQSHRIYDRFIQNNSTWLDSDLIIPEEICNFVVSPPREDIPGPSRDRRRRGRPRKLFSDSSRKSKRRKVQTLLQSSSADEISFAAESTLRAAGKRDAAEIFKEISTASPQRATKIKKLRESDSSSSLIPYSYEEALALFLDARLTVN